MAIKPTHDIEWIDAKKAAKMLEKVHPRQDGRHIPSVIASYAKQMLDGHWDNNVLQTIGFDSDGHLINGYHRLNALVAAKTCKIQALVVRGVSPDSFGKWDSNSPRPIHFQAELSADRTAVLCSIIRLACYPTSPGRVTIEQVHTTDDYVKAALDHQEAVHCKVRRRRIATATVRAGVLLSAMAHPKNADEIHDAYNKLATLSFNDAPRSMTNLYKRLIEETHPPIMQIVMAWHAFDPSKFSNTRIQIKDMRSNVDEIKVRVLKDLVGAVT